MIPYLFPGVFTCHIREEKNVFRETCISASWGFSQTRNLSKYNYLSHTHGMTLSE